MLLPESITIDDAIRRGNKIIVRSRLLRIALLICSVIPFMIDSFKSTGSVFAGCFCLAGAIVFPLLYGFSAIAKWRVWAFSRVNNGNELMTIAIFAGILPRKNSWSNKLFIQSKKDKADWDAIQQRMKIPILYAEDHSVPDSIAIFNYKIYRNLIMAAVMGLICFFCLRYNGFPAVVQSLFSGQMQFAVLLIPILLIVITIVKWTNRKLRKPYLVLSIYGIETPTTSMKWAHISSEKIEESYGVIHAHNGGTIRTNTILSFKYRGKNVSLDINNVSESKARIYYLLRAYRNRYERSSEATTAYKNTAISF